MFVRTDIGSSPVFLISLQFKERTIIMYVREATIPHSSMDSTNPFARPVLISRIKQLSDSDTDTDTDKDIGTNCTLNCSVDLMVIIFLSIFDDSYVSSVLFESLEEVDMNRVLDIVGKDESYLCSCNNDVRS